MKKQGPGLLHDVMFKVVFASRQGEPILRSLLNTILKLPPGEEIVHLELISSNPVKGALKDKGPVFDLRACDERGSVYNVEIQLRDPKSDDYLKRSLYYGTTIYSKELKAGQSYAELKRTVCISILDFRLDALRGHPMHNRFLFREPDRNFNLCDDLEFHYIELGKLRKKIAGESWSKLEKWLYALKSSKKYYTDALPAHLVEVEEIVMAIDSMKKAYARDEVREQIFAHDKAERDRLSRERYAQMKLEQAQRETEQAERKAEQERTRAEQERTRAEQERARAEQASADNARLREKLRELGVEP